MDLKDNSAFIFHTPTKDNDFQEEQRNFKLCVPKTIGIKNCNFLTIPQWITMRPEGLNPKQWQVYSRPDGKRCLIRTFKGITLCSNEKGKLIGVFLSRLPGGSPCMYKKDTMDEDSNGKEKGDYARCVLDCIYYHKLKTFYIMDVMEWEGNEVYQYRACQRYEMIEKALNSEELSVTKVSKDNAFVFGAPKKEACSSEGFKRIYNQDTPYIKDGIMFSHKDASYVGGVNRNLLIWRDPKCSLHTMKQERKKFSVECVLQLKPSNEFVTAEGNVVFEWDRQMRYRYNREEYGRFYYNKKEKNLYVFSIGGMVTDEFTERNYHIEFQDVKLLGRAGSGTARADCLNMIVHQFIEKERPVMSEDVISAILNSENKIVAKKIDFLKL